MNKFDELENKIMETFECKTYEGFTPTNKKLLELTGKEFYISDSDYDDGIGDDESEDNYVMYAIYTSIDEKMDVKFFYGDNTHWIGYVEVDFY